MDYRLVIDSALELKAEAEKLQALIVKKTALERELVLVNNELALQQPLVDAKLAALQIKAGEGERPK